MKMVSRYDLILINYIRISLISGVLSSVSLLLIYLFKTEISTLIGTILVGILMVSVPAFFILPGLIYKDFKTGWTFTMDQMVYYAFALFTLGIGPALIFFIKFEPLIRSMQKNENN
jgi:hypothetical protein